MSTIAETIKAFYVDNDKQSGREIVSDWDALTAECEQKGTVTQDWENETTEYGFADGSVILINNGSVTAHGSR